MTWAQFQRSAAALEEGRGGSLKASKRQSEIKHIPGGMSQLSTPLIFQSRYLLGYYDAWCGRLKTGLEIYEQKKQKS